jgi:hypothetical protein
MNCTPSTHEQRDQESQESFPSKISNKHNPAQRYGMNSSPVKGKSEKKGPRDSYDTSHLAPLAFTPLNNHSGQILGKKQAGEDETDGKGAEGEEGEGKVEKTEKGPSDSYYTFHQAALVVVPLNSHSGPRLEKKRVGEDETNGKGIKGEFDTTQKGPSDCSDTFNQARLAFTPLDNHSVQNSGRNAEKKMNRTENARK